MALSVGSVEYHQHTLTGSCTVMSRCKGRTAARVLHPAIGITT
jgi:hypothetical protein